ncbi:MAG: SDR family NAD(P)-dependent oxidoreductase [Austwickia sp.]|nr:SDR family NAD(P)-dependent oxidoreductase [Austwickia sp.]
MKGLRSLRGLRGGEPLRGQRVWLIGASSGIGAATAEELARRGAKVAISARSADELAEVAARAGEAVVAPADVTDAAAVAAAHDQVRRELGGLDMVIWCAGYWKQTDAAQWDAEVFARHVEVNLLGLNHVLAVVLPPFVAQRRGHLVGVASVAGYRGLPGGEAYGTTKAAQLHLLESLRGALAPYDVTVTTVAPGFVDTPMTATNEFPMPFLMEPQEAARDLCDGLERGASTIIFPLPMAVFTQAARLLPGPVWTLLTRTRRDR